MIALPLYLWRLHNTELTDEDFFESEFVSDKVVEACGRESPTPVEDSPTPIVGTRIVG